MKKHLLLAAVSVVLFAAALAAHAADPAMNEAARAALRDGDYARVVQLTSEIAKTEPDAALNWYRMAIAASRSGDPARASEALARAERADPALRFASTPQRVEKLRADIRAALAQASAAIDEAAAAPAPTPSVATQEVDPGATASVAIVGQQIQGMQQALDKRLDDIAKELSAVSSNQAAAVRASNWERAAWIIGFLVAIVMCAALIALYMERAARARRQAELRSWAQLPLQQLVALTRDTNALLMQRLERHGHKDTDLFTQLLRSQPALERESGRSPVSIAALTGGKLLADVNHPLQGKAKVLGHSDPGELHRSVAARMVRQPGEESQAKLAA